jgi:hypothetical protein
MQIHLIEITKVELIMVWEGANSITELRQLSDREIPSPTISANLMLKKRNLKSFKGHLQKVIKLQNFLNHRNN